MTDADLYSGIISPEKQAAYEQWLIDRYGTEIGAQIERSREARGKTDHQAMATAMKELESIEQALAEGLRRGIPAQATSLDSAIERHRAWVARSWGRDCTPQAYAGLADIYEHPDFQARYEAIQPGFADYLTTAMRAWSRRQDD